MKRKKKGNKVAVACDCGKRFAINDETMWARCSKCGKAWRVG